jgi:hypothetical protein
MISPVHHYQTPAHTQHLAILGEEGRVRPEVDTAADDIQCGELLPIRLPRCRIAEDLSVIAMVRK